MGWGERLTVKLATDGTGGRENRRVLGTVLAGPDLIGGAMDGVGFASEVAGAHSDCL